jgi:hypothetical protein
MRSRALVLAALVTALAGCGLMPLPQGAELPGPCSRDLDPNAGLVWAGWGDVADFDLIPAGDPRPPPGDIYVGWPRDPSFFEPNQRVFCLLDADRVEITLFGAVPDGWEPP